MKAKLSTLRRKTKKPTFAGWPFAFIVDFTDEFSNSIVNELQILAGLKAYLADF
jgi:hypothetical protein